MYNEYFLFLDIYNIIIVLLIYNRIVFEIVNIIEN